MPLNRVALSQSSSAIKSPEDSKIVGRGVTLISFPLVGPAHAKSTAIKTMLSKACQRAGHPHTEPDNTRPLPRLSITAILLRTTVEVCKNTTQKPIPAAFQCLDGHELDQLRGIACSRSLHARGERRKPSAFHLPRVPTIVTRQSYVVQPTLPTRVIAFMRRLWVILFLLFNAPLAQALIKAPREPSFESHSVEALTAASPLILLATMGLPIPLLTAHRAIRWSLLKC